MEKKRLGNFFLKRKRGGTNLLLPEIMFILLNLIFFSIIIAFVYISSTGALFYDKAHAKQIALVLDNANSNTIVVIDFVFLTIYVNSCWSLWILNIFKYHINSTD